MGCLGVLLLAVGIGLIVLGVRLPSIYRSLGWEEESGSGLIVAGAAFAGVGLALVAATARAGRRSPDEPEPTTPDG